jgi:hypothetical protein
MSIPKALIHIKEVMAVSPTEEQLLEYYKDYGYETIEDILEGHAGGSWEILIRDWYVNTNFTQPHKDHQTTNNIFRFENDNENEEVEILSEDEWTEFDEDGRIF